MPKWLELMRTGVFTDRHGVARNITGDVLARVARGYDSAVKAAHMIVGHPDLATVPSFGIIDKIKVVGDKLLGLPKNVVPEFAALVAKGGFKNVSVGFNEAMDKLDHVAFLSAGKPAVDGLAPVVEFSARVEEVNTVSIDITNCFDCAQFSASGWIGWRLSDIGTLFRKLRDNLIEKDGAEKADQVIPAYLIDNLMQQPPAVPENMDPQFSQPEGGMMSIELQKLLDAELAKTATLTQKLAEFSSSHTTVTAQVAALTAENAALKTALAKFETDAIAAEFSAYVEKLIDEKKVLPKEKAAFVDALVKLRTASGAEFSTEGSPLTLFKAQIEARGKVAPSDGHTADLRGAEFSAGTKTPLQLSNEIVAYQAEQKKIGREISASQASAELFKK